MKTNKIKYIIKLSKTELQSNKQKHNQMKQSNEESITKKYIIESKQ